MLQARAVSKAYGTQMALDQVDLDVAAGEITALLGRNGAGKTTLVSIVAGLRSRDSGAISINGIDTAGDPGRAHAAVGLAPQETGVYPSLSCRDNLRVFNGLAGGSRRDARTTIDELAETLALTDLLDRPAKELSGGERRRLHTAIALVGHPALVLLDEPTVGADVQTRTQLLSVVRGLARDGAAVVYSTHYLPEVEALDATVAILERGQMLARGTIDDIVTEHSTGLVDFSFAGSAPDVGHLFPNQTVTASGSRVQIETNDPTHVTAVVLAGMDTRTAELRGLTVSQPSLEAAFLRITGDPSAVATEELTDVA